MRPRPPRSTRTAEQFQCDSWSRDRQGTAGSAKLLPTGRGSNQRYVSVKRFDGHI